MFIAALLTVAKTWKYPVSIDECVDKEDMIHTHTHTFVATWNNMDKP